MKEQIQQLIAAGNLEEALDLLAESNSEAVLLQSRFNGAKKQYNMGMVPFDEWQRTQNQISYAALEMVKTLGKNDGGDRPKPPSGGGGSSQGDSSGGSGASSGKPTVFISYNHKDAEPVGRIKQYLETNDVTVTIDHEQLAPGKSIVDFIKESMKNNNVILSVISENSLKSGWVGKESVASMFSEWLTNQRFIPVSLDHSFTSDDFYLEALEALVAEIEDKKIKVQKAQSLGGKIGPIQESVDRLLDLRHNLGDILERLKDRFVVDISADKFDYGMSKVLAEIKK